VHDVERHMLYVPLVPRMDHPRSVEPLPRNVQRCYAHVNVEKGDEAPSTETNTGSRATEKHLVTPEHSKKRPGSSKTMGMSENLTSKRHRIIQDWSDEDKEKNLTTDLLKPRWRKGVELTVQEGPSRPAAALVRGTPMASTAATSHVPPPSDGG
jgi:hypothetical protein